MKLLLIGDLHFGEKSNSRKHNEQTLELLEWAVAQGRDCDAVVQMGDFFHDRSRIQLETLEYGVDGAQILMKAFGKDNAYVLAGNHDIFYLNRLDVTSLRSIEPYVTLVDAPMEIDEKTMLTPWIVDEDHWKQVCDAPSQGYETVLGHFELNGFDMGGGYVMEKGYSPSALKAYKKVITGHYHSPQKKGNVQYIGIPFPVSMSEANTQLGVWTYDTDTHKLTQVPYNHVKVVSMDYESFQEGDFDLDENTTIRVELPDDITDEDYEALEEKLQASQADYKLKYEGNKVKEIIESDVEVVEVDNIDESVLGSFDNVKYQSEDIDPSMLKNLYQKAIDYVEPTNA